MNFSSRCSDVTSHIFVFPVLFLWPARYSNKGICSFLKGQKKKRLLFRLNTCERIIHETHFFKSLATWCQCVWMIKWVKAAKRTSRNQGSLVKCTAGRGCICSIMRDLLVTVTCDRLLSLQVTGLIERSRSGTQRGRTAVWSYSATERGMQSGRFIYAVNVSERSWFVSQCVYLTGEDGD